MLDKPKLIYVYDYLMEPWNHRKFCSPTFLLECALKEFFKVYHVGEIEEKDADFVFNTQPVYKPRGEDELIRGRKTAFWNQVPLEGLFDHYVDQVDILFHSVPGFLGREEYKGKDQLLLAGVNPHYNYTPQEFKYDVGFLGSEAVGERVNLLNEVAKNFTLLRGAAENLGGPSAKLLSQCKLVLSVEDYYNQGAGIEHRIWTFGNVRPILMRWNPDLNVIGAKNRLFISYGSVEGLITQIKYYLEHMDEAEAIGKNLQQEFQDHHTYQHRAKQVYDAFRSIK
jgi:hypothetical protein